MFSFYRHTTPFKLLLIFSPVFAQVKMHSYKGQVTISHSFFSWSSNQGYAYAFISIRDSRMVAVSIHSLVKMENEWLVSESKCTNWIRKGWLFLQYSSKAFFFLDFMLFYQHRVEEPGRQEGSVILQHCLSRNLKNGKYFISIVVDL